jgi:hypothetical protein
MNAVMGGFAALLMFASLVPTAPALANANAATGSNNALKNVFIFIKFKVGDLLFYRFSIVTPAIGR